MRTRTLSLVVVLGAGAAGAQSTDDVRARLAEGRYDDAEAAARAGLEQARALTSDTAAVAQALELLSDALVRNGRIAGREAEHAAREALTLESERAGRESPDTARAAVALGSALLAQGAPHEAAPFLDRALTLLGASDDGAVSARIAQAALRLEQDDPRGSLAAADEGLRLARAATEATPADVARLLDAKALALQMLGDWAAADTAAAEALALREAFVAGHPDSTVTQLLLGDSGWRAGDMPSAGEHYRRAVALAEATLRPGHPLLTRAEGRLATWEATTGQLGQALPRHRAALEAARENLGPDHPRLADYLNDQANALVSSGDAESAIALYEEAVALAERVYGAESPSVATPLYNLGWAHAEQGAWDAATPPLARALEFWRRAYGDSDARVLLAYRHWADVLAGGGRDAQAVAYYERALRLRLAAGESRHPATVSLRGRLALALERLGRHAEAQRYAVEAEAGLRGRSGLADREHAEVLALLARLALARGDGTRPVLHWATSADVSMRRHVRDTVRFLPDRQALDYVGQRFEGRDAVLSLLAERPGDRLAATAGLDLVARARNLVLDEMAGRSSVARAPARVHSVSTARRLASLLYRGVWRQGPDGEALLRAARLEYDAAARDEALSTARRPHTAEFEGDLVAELARRLAPGTALASFSVYRPARRPDERAYVAFVLRAGWRHPRVVPLGDARAIDELVQRWHALVERPARLTGSRAAKRAALDDVARRLGERLWTPLRGALQRARRVLLVPDGHLNLVNFAALIDGSGRYLLETGPTLHLLSGERDLLREAPAARAPSLLIVADPDFDDGQALVTTADASGAATRITQEHAETWRGLGVRCTDIGALHFEPLPASRREAAALSALWLERTGVPPDVLAGATATETRLKAAASEHSIVHVASHGFALPVACAAATRAPARAPAPRLSPLLLGGVALAGANRRREAAALDDDGILTSEELAGLDLRGVDWVVLAGCDTGRGEVRPSEGVVGLRRALALAGARTVVMSLWPVVDEDARAWMAALYDGRLGARLDTPEAVRRASLAMLRRLRDAGSAADPSRWAAFVATGDTR